jgi:hypothetical protein
MSGTWNFNPLAFDPATGSGGLPVGKYPVVIKRSAREITQDRTGAMLVCSLEIIDGPHKGITGVYRLNLWNANTQASEIAARQLSALCYVTQTWGLSNLPEGVELWNKPFVVQVVLQKNAEAAEKGYTQVDSVYDMNGNAPVKQAGAPQQQPPQNAPPQQMPGQPPQQGFAPQQPQQPQQPYQQPAQQPYQPQPQQQPVQQQPYQPPQQPAQQQPQQAPAQPSWSQQPPAGAAPSWQR